MAKLRIRKKPLSVEKTEITANANSLDVNLETYLFSKELNKMTTIQIRVDSLYT